jgi:hypothetical protein
MNYVWVIEMFNPRSKKWQACSSAELTKKYALREVSMWRENNPDDLFRLTKYIPSKE